jgi:hypothetical protein
MGGDGMDDPDMLLQSTAALATSPLHDCSGDGSSLEETSHSLDAVVVPIVLGDLPLLLLRLSRSMPSFRDRFVSVEDRLLQERHLG